MRLFRRIYEWCAAPERLFALTVIVLALPNVALCLTERMTWPARVCNVLLPVCVYWFAMTLGRRPGRTVWALFPLVFLAAFQLVLLYLFGHSVIAVDMFLNLVTTNAGEALELLDNLVPAVAGVFAIYLPVLITGAVSAFGDSRLGDGFLRGQRRASLAGIVAGVVSLGVCYASDRDYSARTDLYPLNVFYNLGLAVERTYATEHYAEMSAGFRFGARPVHPADSAEVYVLVIGETARAMDFGIYGYRRNTTPMLERTEGLVAFTGALTQSNTTHKSVPMLLSAASADDYGCIYREKGVIAAFREAGFHTVFISNQRPNHSFIDIFGKEADEWAFVRENAPEGAGTPDGGLLRMTAETLSKKRKKELIVLHTYGSHFNYRERYPQTAAVFRPDDATDAIPENRPSLINAYDNTIRYTDWFLYRLIAMLGDRGGMAALIYTSDHGENVFDDGRSLFLHASPVPSYYELHVPLLVWMSDAYRSACADKARALEGNRRKSVATSASVFHTMLDMAGVATPFRTDTLSVASRNYRPATLRYLNDHNRSVPLGRIVTDREDVEMFARMGIAYP